MNLRLLEVAREILASERNEDGEHRDDVATELAQLVLDEAFRDVDEDGRCPHGYFYTGAGACPACEGET